MSKMNKASLARPVHPHRILSDDDWVGLPEGAPATVSGRVEAMWSHMIMVRCHDGSLMAVRIEGPNRYLLIKGTWLERVAARVTARGMTVTAETVACLC